MIPPKPLPNEEERLAALFRQQILDSPEETGFNEIVELAARVFNLKVSLISLIDDHRQWFKARVGFDTAETPKVFSFCAHAIQGDDIFEIPDASLDERFIDNPMVTGDPNVRFYAGQPICSEDGYKLGTLCLIDDRPRQLTEEQREILRVLAKQVERQLALRLQLLKREKAFALIKTQAAALEELNLIKDQLLGVLSHDLRSPLAMLEGILELFAMEALDASEIVDLMREVRGKIQQTEAQLSRVLAWSQQQVMGQVVGMNSFSLGSIADQVLPWVEHQAAQKQIVITTAIEADLSICGDQDLVNLVLRNLLANAVKYSRRGDQVILFAQREGDYVSLGVRDRGLGMKPATLKKLRDRNYQISAPGTENESGTGLGLLLCQTYLNKMNTGLDIESSWTKGSTFSFRLAIAKNAEGKS